MGIDIKDYYLNNVLPRKEYLRIPAKVIPQEIIDQYNLEPLIHNGYVYVQITLLNTMLSVVTGVVQSLDCK